MAGQLAYPKIRRSNEYSHTQTHAIHIEFALIETAYAKYKCDRLERRFDWVLDTYFVFY